MSTNGAVLLSVAVHASLAAAVGVLPLVADEALPAPSAPVVECEPIFVVPLPRLAGDPHHRGSAVPRVVTHVPAPAAPSLPLVDPGTLPDAETIGDDSLGAVADGDGPGGRDGVVGGVIGDPEMSPPSPPPIVRIGNGLTAPRLARRVEPSYPALAAAARATATVLLEAEVDAKGEVIRASVVHGHPLFDAAAIEAVERWRYQPLLLNGVPTAFILTVTVRFGLLH